MLALLCSQLLFYCLSVPFSLALSQKNEVGINSTKTNATKVLEVEALRCTVYKLGKQELSYSLALVDLIPSWLVLAEISRYKSLLS